MSVEMRVSGIGRGVCSVSAPKQVKWETTLILLTKWTTNYFLSVNPPLGLFFWNVLSFCRTIRNMRHIYSQLIIFIITILIIFCWICCSCPSSLKARGGADQLSSSGSRSCPKKTILLPSSSSTSSLSLHSEVTHSLLYLSVSVCLSLPQIHGKPI